MNKTKLALVAALVFSAPAFSQTPPLVDQRGTCGGSLLGDINGNCTNESLHSGDTTQTSHDGDSRNTAVTQDSPSTSVSSGNSQAFDNRAQTAQNSDINAKVDGKIDTNVTGGNVSGGNNTASVTGGPVDASSQSKGNTSKQSMDNSGNSKSNASTSDSGNSRSASSNQSSLTSGDNMQKSRTDVSVDGARSNTNVSSSDNRSSSTSYVDNSRLVYVAPIIPPQPASSLQVGALVKETTECMPLQVVVERPITGYFHGILFTTANPQGYHQALVPYVDAAGVQQEYKRVPIMGRGSLAGIEVGYALFGTQAVIVTGVLGTSGARNIGGGGSGGNGGGSLGVGGSSNMQQLATTITARSCSLGSYMYSEYLPKPAIPQAEKEPVIEIVPPKASKPPVLKKRVIIKKPIC